MEESTVEEMTQKIESKASTEASTDQEVTDEFQLEFKYADPEKQIEKDWMERNNLDLDGLSGALESLLFLSDKPIPLLDLKNMIDEQIPLKVVNDCIKKLQAEYEQKHHGIRLQEVAQGFQFRTKQSFSRFVQGMFKTQTLVLSPTALEVLAIIAYRGPVSRIDIEKVRGVESGHIIRALMDRRLVKAEGRSEEIGRPVLYRTTNEFLEVFNLKNLEDLPPEYELEKMMTKNQLGQISDIKEIVGVEDRAKYHFNELEELDELQASIKDVSTQTDFIKLLKNNDKNKTDAQTIQKSAFDLLEEYLEADVVKSQNKLAAESVLISLGIEPQIVSDLSKLDHNAPEIDNDEISTVLEPASTEELYHRDASLDEEVDAAFDQLMDDQLDNSWEESFGEEEEKELATAESKVEDLWDTALNRAKDFDFDLEDPDKNS